MLFLFTPSPHYRIDLAQLSKVARNTVMPCWNVWAKCAVGRALASRRYLLFWASFIGVRATENHFILECLPLLRSFSLGRRFATSLLASHLTDNFRHPVGFVSGAKIIRVTYRIKGG